MEIHYKEYNKYRDYRKQINESALEDLVIYDAEDNIVKLDKDTQDDFRFTGLNVTDYIDWVYHTLPDTFILREEDH